MKPIISQKQFLFQAVRLLIIGVSVVSVVNLSRSIWDLWHRRDILTERQAVLRQLQEENQRLQNELEYAQSPEFVEKEARNRLGLGREGEAVVLLPKSQIPISNFQTKEEKEENAPNWKRWWRLFF